MFFIMALEAHVEGPAETDPTKVSYDRGGYWKADDIRYDLCGVVSYIPVYVPRVPSCIELSDQSGDDSRSNSSSSSEGDVKNQNGETPPQRRKPNGFWKNFFSSNKTPNITR